MTSDHASSAEFAGTASADETHAFLTPERIERAGEISAPLLLSDSSWVERRKESVEIIDDATVRRQISVDFSLRTAVPPFEPDDGIGVGDIYCAPAFVLPKSPANLMAFDLVDASGASLRLQSRRDNAEISAATIARIAKLVLEEDLDPALERRLRDVALVDAPTGKELAKQILRGPAQGPAERALRTNARFRQWLEIFGHSSLCVVLFRAQTRRRALVKLSFTGPITPSEPWLGARLGWAPYRLVVHIPLLEARTFHFEAEAPSGLRITEAVLSDSQQAEEEEPRRERGLLRRVHLYREAARQAGAGTAVLWLSVDGRSFITGAGIASVATFLVLLLFTIMADKIAANPTSAPALLLVIPGVLASYVARPERHPLTGRLLSTARLLLFGSALCAYAAAAAVALGGAVAPETIAERESTLRSWLIVFTVISGVLVVPLTWAWVKRIRTMSQWAPQFRSFIAATPDIVRSALVNNPEHARPDGYDLVEDQRFGGADGLLLMRSTGLGDFAVTYELEDSHGLCKVSVDCEFFPRFPWVPWPRQRNKEAKRVETSLERLKDWIEGADA